MSDELFELCKEVYERTGWRPLAPEGTTVSYWVQHDDEYDLEYGAVGLPIDGGVTPLYTSDYLLEKLPPHIKLEKTNRYYAIWLDDEDDIKGHAFGDDISPLKALLKLVIALHKARELTHVR